MNTRERLIEISNGLRVRFIAGECSVCCLCRELASVLCRSGICLWVACGTKNAKMSALPRPTALDAAEDHFQRCRELWLRYMNMPDKPRWYPSRDATCRQAKSNEAATIEDRETPYTRADLRTMHAFNACVDSLEPHQRAAVYRAHGLGNAFRFLRMDYEKSLASGMRRLRELVAERC